MNTLQNKWESRQIEHIFYADIVQHGTKSANTCNLTTLNNTGELLALRQKKKKKKMGTFKRGKNSFTLQIHRFEKNTSVNINTTYKCI